MSLRAAIDKKSAADRPLSNLKSTPAIKRANRARASASRAAIEHAKPMKAFLKQLRRKR